MNRRRKDPKPPAHLAAPTRAWWTEIMDTYELESQHVLLLTAACEALDLAAQARRAIEKFGLTFNDAHGCPRARPECAVFRNSQLAFARMTRELGLDCEPPSTPRPPTLAGNAGRRR